MQYKFTWLHFESTPIDENRVVEVHTEHELVAVCHVVD